jgi:RNA polymerase sigma factor (TIGR02999 family)
MSDAHEITTLLARLRPEDEATRERLWTLLYPSLHTIAAREMRKDRPDQTLQPAALVNEGYLRLAEQTGSRWNGRRHFLAAAAAIMRHILVDRARARGARKRGGGQKRLSLDAAGSQLSEAPQIDVLVLEEALRELAERSPRQAQVVELRFFGGLEVEEIAKTIGVSPRTVKSQWAAARAFLRRRLEQH